MDHARLGRVLVISPIGKLIKYPQNSYYAPNLSSCVMEGKHSVDVGILVLPAIIETMKLIGDSANVKYNTGMETDNTSLSLDMEKRVAADLSNKDMIEEDSVKKEEIVIEEDTAETSENSMGLMSRRV